jgi:magnesium transporter
MFALGEPDRDHLRAALKRVAPEDVAAVLSDLSLKEKLQVFRALPSNEEKSVALEETDQQSRREVLDGLSEEERVQVLGEMPVDDLVDRLEELPEDERRRVIATLEKEEATEVKELLAFPPETAGGMMTTEFLAIPLGVTSRDALAKVQGNLKVEVISYVYVTDTDGVLRGVVSIRGILNAKPETPVESYMERDVISVPATADREEVTAAVDKYNLAVVPVVDDAGRLKGIITFDDVIDAVQEEHSEDMLRMAGTVAVHPYYEPIHLGVLKRLPFLLVTLVGGFGVLLVKALFEKDIPPALFTAALGIVPLLSGLSGNVAIVTATIMVRGLATGDINVLRAGKAVGREVTVAIVVGLVLAAVVTATLSLIGGREYGEGVGLVVGLGLCASVTWAALLGALVPLLCKLSRFVDPAIASGPFVTMACDISASLIFLFLVFAFLTRGP